MYSATVVFGSGVNKEIESVEKTHSTGFLSSCQVGRVAREVAMRVYLVLEHTVVLF
jgi:hypothetical protein